MINCYVIRQEIGVLHPREFLLLMSNSWGCRYGLENVTRSTGPLLCSSIEITSGFVDTLGMLVRLVWSQQEFAHWVCQCLHTHGKKLWQPLCSARVKRVTKVWTANDIDWYLWHETPRLHDLHNLDQARSRSWLVEVKCMISSSWPWTQVKVKSMISTSRSWSWTCVKVKEISQGYSNVLDQSDSRSIERNFKMASKCTLQIDGINAPQLEAPVSGLPSPQVEKQYT